MSKAVLTYSALRMFQSCRRKYYLRYNECLVPIKQDTNLYLGSVWHSVLELWYKPGECDAKVSVIQDLIDKSFPDRISDPGQKRDWHLCHAMFAEYIQRYPEEDFQVLGVEQEFAVPVVNPASNRSSRTFELKGKVDGIVRMRESDELLLMEHKSTSMISGDYLERLPGDFQIQLYQLALSRHIGKPINAVIYNVAQKAALRQSEGESEEEFQIRRADLINKSRHGRSSAKRRLPESDEEFQARLTEKYHDPSMFHRELLYLSRQDTDRTQREIWELSQQILTARRGGFWSPNWDSCFHFGSCPCGYWPLCRSDNSSIVKDNLFEHRPPHSELSDVVEDANDEYPIF